MSLPTRRSGYKFSDKTDKMIAHIRRRLGLLCLCGFGMSARAQQTISYFFNGDLAPYDHIQAINEGGNDTVKLGNIVASNAGSDNILALNVYRGANGDWWAAHVHITGDGGYLQDLYGVDIGPSGLGFSDSPFICYCAS